MTHEAPEHAVSSFGVYLHIPFCAKRCDYCAFATWDDRSELVDRYLRALATEVQGAVDAGLPRAGSIFVGGGTPSMVDPTVLGRVVTSLPRQERCEVTVECNPDTVTAALLAAYREAGVNRISLGVQSMVPHVLRALGRTHTIANVAVAMRLVRDAGFDSSSIDLIYGTVGESLDDWIRSIDEVVALDPDHVSAYALTPEPGTPLAADATRHPDDDEQADKYQEVDRRLQAAGMSWYEISNWAKPGHECRHNQLYWALGDYRGFGCAAHSHASGRRWWNLRTPERYLAAVEAGESTEAGAEDLDERTRHLEGRQLALRTLRGVPAVAFEADDLAQIAHLVQPGGQGLVLNEQGRMLANEVAIRLR